MNKERLIESFDKMTPDEVQKRRMWDIMLKQQSTNLPKQRRSRIWLALTAACFVAALLLIITIPFGKPASVYAIHAILEDDAAIKLADKENDTGSAIVSYVDARPHLNFYIDGEDIAKIEISTENEYIHAKDWTETQHRKYWDIEYFQTFDEEKQTYIADYDLIYDKNITMNFAEEFTEYTDIWYQWRAWDMYNWAVEDNFSRFLGYGIPYDSNIPNIDELSEQEKLELAAGSGSGLGHMQLDDYPDHLQEDTITIKITDRNGNVTTKKIHVKVSNNPLGQTVVNAQLIR